MGLPNPVRESGVLLYPQLQVDAWLKTHPAGGPSPLEQLIKKLLDDRAAGGGNRLSIVRDAKASDFSWATVTDALNAVDDRAVSRQAVAKRYGPHL